MDKADKADKEAIQARNIKHRRHTGLTRDKKRTIAKR